MSQSAFGRLLYTDCKLGDGLGAGGGLQIQARSTGVTPGQSSMVVSSLTYAIQAGWFTEGRPASEWPLGLAHAAGDGFGTAQSRYLGQGVNDPRPGNYLTDALLTQDARSYGVIRPAQLWLAEHWREEPWPTTQAPPFEEWLEPGRLDNDELARWLSAEPSRAERLGRLVSVLEDPEGPQVIIRSATPEAALRWIGAATILLPMARAVGVSFRVFSSTRSDPRFRVLAVPGDLFGEFIPGSSSVTFVLDDLTGATDEVRVSDRAMHWVNLLVAEEPYDVVAAVDLAEQLAPAEGEDEGLAVYARSVAWMLTSGESHGDPDAAWKWLTSASDAAVREHGEAVARHLLSHPTTSAIGLGLVDDMVSRGQLALDPTEVRARLIDREVHDSQESSGLPLVRALKPVQFTPAQHAELQSRISSAIVLGSDEEIGRLLTIVGRHRFSMSPLSPAVVRRLEDFVTACFKQPDLWRGEEWVTPENFLLDVLHSRLVEVHDAGSTNELRRVLPHFAAALEPFARDPQNPLAWQIEACLTRSSSPKHQVDRVRAVTSGRRLRGSGPRDDLRYYQEVLAAWDALEDIALMELVRSLPHGMPLHRDLSVRARRSLEECLANPGRDDLDALVALNRRGELPRRGRARTLAAAATSVDDVIRRARRGGLSDRGSEPYLQDLGNVPDRVLAAYTPLLMEVARTSEDPDVGARVLSHRPAPAAGRFRARWISEEVLRGRLDPRSVIRSLEWATLSELIDESTRAALVDAVVESLTRLDGPMRQDFLQKIEARLTDSASPAWDWVRQELPGEPGRIWRRKRR